MTFDERLIELEQISYWVKRSFSTRTNRLLLQLGKLKENILGQWFYQQRKVWKEDEKKMFLPPKERRISNSTGTIAFL